MSRTPPSDTALRVADLSPKADTAFDLRPGTAALAAIAEELDLSALRKLSFAGTLRAVGRDDWQLDGRLGATVVQPCVITLEPVTTRIDRDVSRLFLRDFARSDAPEAEMAGDEDHMEPLEAWIDPGRVLREALAIAVPDYPRKDAAELGQLVHTKPGAAPMTDADARPFAGLAALRGTLGDADKD